MNEVDDMVTLRVACADTMRRRRFLVVAPRMVVSSGRWL